MSTTFLSGQDTLLASWRALADLSPGARLVRTQSTIAAVFPAWAPLNNAILLAQPSSTTAATAAAELKYLYRSAGVDAWALWLPSAVTTLDGADEVAVVGGMRRDTTTLVMQRELTGGTPEAEGVIRTSVDAAGRAGDEPVAAADLEAPDDGSPLDAWVIVRDGLAVAGAWSLVDGVDCGIYAVGTSPTWRRRGLARALMLTVLGDAYRRGARTATLQSTAMGEPLYASLGFSPTGRYDEWVQV
jgi:GNAT superfamily N-acetyltransferase